MSSSRSSMMMPKWEYSRILFVRSKLVLERPTMYPLRRRAMIFRVSGSMMMAETVAMGLTVCILSTGVPMSFIDDINISIF